MHPELIQLNFKLLLPPYSIEIVNRIQNPLRPAVLTLPPPVWFREHGRCIETSDRMLVFDESERLPELGFGDDLKAALSGRQAHLGVDGMSLLLVLLTLMHGVHPRPRKEV